MRNSWKIFTTKFLINTNLTHLKCHLTTMEIVSELYLEFKLIPGKSVSITFPDSGLPLDLENPPAS